MLSVKQPPLVRNLQELFHTLPRPRVPDDATLSVQFALADETGSFMGNFVTAPTRLGDVLAGHSATIFHHLGEYFQQLADYCDPDTVHQVTVRASTGPLASIPRQLYIRINVLGFAGDDEQHSHSWVLVVGGSALYRCQGCTLRSTQLMSASGQRVMLEYHRGIEDDIKRWDMTVS